MSVLKFAFLSVFRKRTGEIESLNGLRAFAILCILIFHTSPFLEFAGMFTGNIAILFPGLQSGVALFFVLSGYLISFGLMKEWEKNHRINFSLFFINRSLRIFPAYYFYLILAHLVALKIAEALVNSQAAGPAELATSAESVLAKIDNFKYDLIYMSDYFQSYNVHTWSLSIEEKFYLILPFLSAFFIFRLAKVGRLLFLCFLYLVPLFFRISSYYDPATLYPNYHSFHFRFDDLIAGIIVMDLHLHWNIQPIIKRFQNILIPIILLGYGSTLFFSQHSFPFFYYVFSFNGFNIIFSMLLLICLSEQNILKSFFELKIFRPIARLSYTMYLWNGMIALLSIKTATDKINKGGTVTWFDYGSTVINFFFLTLLISYLLYLLVEYPFLFWKERLKKSKQPSNIT
ncbi:acyltransferase family protein [Leptospira meyeri]|uniref:acyltransferase family protein n=1 Tax=Leptospira meyeri TaxID=29508 RepID=UPI00108374F5|nr:acyltransferase [Leptospira meyeri]TGL12884.1 acyltransferase [Leptospira meyeri]